MAAKWVPSDEKRAYRRFGTVQPASDILAMRLEHCDTECRAGTSEWGVANSLGDSGMDTVGTGGYCCDGDATGTGGGSFRLLAE